MNLSYGTYIEFQSLQTPLQRYIARCNEMFYLYVSQKYMYRLLWKEKTKNSDVLCHNLSKKWRKSTVDSQKCQRTSSKSQTFFLKSTLKYITFQYCSQYIRFIQHRTFFNKFCNLELSISRHHPPGKNKCCTIYIKTLHLWISMKSLKIRPVPSHSLFEFLYLPTCLLYQLNWFLIKLFSNTRERERERERERRNNRMSNFSSIWRLSPSLVTVLQI
jgi:hypothetical protein